MVQSIQITEVKGVGLPRAKALEGLGIVTVADLASAPLEQLITLSGISPKIAENLRAAASNLLAQQAEANQAEGLNAQNDPESLELPTAVLASLKQVSPVVEPDPALSKQAEKKQHKAEKKAKKEQLKASRVTSTGAERAARKAAKHEVKATKSAAKALFKAHKATQKAYRAEVEARAAGPETVDLLAAKAQKLLDKSKVLTEAANAKLPGINGTLLHDLLAPKVRKYHAKWGLIDGDDLGEHRHILEAWDDPDIDGPELAQLKRTIMEGSVDAAEASQLTDDQGTL